MFVGKPGTGVYLLRESAKVSKEIKNRKMFTLSKRVGAEEYKEDANMAGQPQAEKRKKGNDGRPVPQPLGGAGRMMLDPPQR